MMNVESETTGNERVVIDLTEEDLDSKMMEIEYETKRNAAASENNNGLNHNPCRYHLLMNLNRTTDE